MTPIVLTPEENERRSRSMRQTVLDRKKARTTDPHAFDSEHPIVSVLWSTLEWLMDDAIFLYGYFDALSPGKAAQLVAHLEASAKRSQHVSRHERMLELFHALTCADPAQIGDATLRRVVSIARIQTTAEQRLEVSP